MDHIFISYSHEDNEYAHKLTGALEGEGFQIWIDDRIDYGSKWPQALQESLDACSAFILIMTPRSYESDWVHNELGRALDKKKPIFPLLLEGDSPWLPVQALQFVDVRSDRLPPPRFYERLAEVVKKQVVEEQVVPKPVKIDAYNLSKGTAQYGRYIIDDGLAYGDIIALYKGWDTRLNRDVMIGVNYKPHFEEKKGEMYKSSVKYVGMQHPNLPEVIDFFFEDGKQFIVLRYDDSRAFSKIVKVIEGLIL